jgi:hypothetical protein
MKFLIRLAICLFLGVVFLAVAAWDGVMEARKKRELGDGYEGPLEGWK